MLPWLIGAAVVAGVGYMASGSDTNDYDDDDYEREERREKRERKREKEREEDALKSEIDSFKKTAIKQILNKYQIQISFKSPTENSSHLSSILNQQPTMFYNRTEKLQTTVYIVDDNQSQITNLKNSILSLKTENNEIQNLINDLQKAKNAI